MSVKSFKLDLTTDLRSWKFPIYSESNAPNSGTLAVNSVFRIEALQLKWRLASGVLCNQQMSTRFKRKFYMTMIRGSGWRW